MGVQYKVFARRTFFNQKICRYETIWIEIIGAHSLKNLKKRVNHYVAHVPSHHKGRRKKEMIK